ncbi:hypothetical protein LguiB_026124 [Lonicera macranthoides]
MDCDCEWEKMGDRHTEDPECQLKVMAHVDARSKNIEDVLILSGDHLYRVDYMDFVQCSLGFHDSRASDFGLMNIDGKGRVLSFSE